MGEEEGMKNDPGRPPAGALINAATTTSYVAVVVRRIYRVL